MRSVKTAVGLAALASVLPVGTAIADPGGDFPEQPGANVDQACITLGPFGPGSRAGQTGSEQARERKYDLYLDACTPLP